MPSLLDRLRAFIHVTTPTKPRPEMNPRAEPFSGITRMDVDQVHAVIEGAQAGDTRDLFALYRDIIVSDAHLQGELHKRKMAVLGDVTAVNPVDKKNAPEAATAALVDSITRTPGWIMACSHLLDATIFPVAVVEKVFAPAPAGSGLQYVVAQLVPVNHQLLDYSQTGHLRIRDVDPASGFPTGTTQEPDPNRYIIHRGHLLSSPDQWGGPMRSLVFWWLFSAMSRDWWARFLDRYGSPFLVGKYDQSDDASRSILERAFGYATKIGGLVVSKETEVEIKAAMTSDSGAAYESFLTICQREKSKLIVGQTLSAEAQPTGMGSGTANAQSDVRNDIRQFDALLLASSLRDQLFVQFCLINTLPGRVPSIVWGSDSVEALQAWGTLLSNLAKAGLQPSDAAIETLSTRFGFGIERSAPPAPAAPAPGPLALPGAPPRLALPAPTATPYAAPRARPGDVPLHVALAHSAVDTIAAAGSADLSQAFRGSLAPIRRIILESHSAAECEQRLHEFYADWEPTKLSSMIAEALQAYAANGAALHGR